MKKIFFYSFFALLSLTVLFSPHLTEAAVITSTATGGVWNVGGTWIGGVAPANTDSVIIATTGGNSVTMGAARTNAGLTVNSGAILNFDGAYVLTENGNVVVNGTVIGSTGTIRMNAAGLTMGGSGSIDSIVLANQNFSFLSSANLTINNNINSAGRTVTNNGTVDLNGNYVRTGGTAIWTQGTNAVLNINGAFTPSANVTLNASAAGNTINYDGAAQVVEPATYANLTLSNSGVKTIAGVTVNGNLTLSGTASATTTAAMTIGGNLNVGAGTVFATGATNTWTLTVNGTTSVSGTLTLANTGSKTFKSDVAINSGATWNETAAAALSFWSSLANNASSFTSSATSYTFSGTNKTLSGSTATVIPGTAIFSGGNYANSGTFSAATLNTLISGASFTNNGTVSVSTALSGSGTFTQGSAGTLNFSGSSIAITTFSASSSGNTVNYDGAAQTIRATTYSNLSFSGSGNKTTAAGTTIVGGDWNIGSGTTALLSTNNSNYTVTGDIAGSGAITSGSGTISIAGNWTNNGTFTKGTGTVTYNGSSTQTVGALTYNNLTINKGGGSASLGGSGTTVDGALTLTAGNITTGANDLYISSTGSVSRTNGHIVGNLRKYIASGATSKTFEIGDSSNYTPADLAFGIVTVAGDLTMSTVATDHPNIGSSDIDPASTANRYWTAANSVSLPISFTDYSATFHFINPGDLDAGADPLSFSVGQYFGSVWSYPTVGTRLTSSTQATGMTSFGDFQLGGRRNPVPTTTSIDPTFKYVGDAQFNMTVNGTNFVSSSVVKFNGSSRATTYINSTQLTATILATDLLTATSSALITVFNPTPGGGTSNAQTFQVRNPMPTTTSIDPTFGIAGNSGFTMTVTGTGYNTSSVVRFNGSGRTTTFISSSTLQAAILTADLTTAGTFPITVFNPTPGGGTSNAQTFIVYNPTPTTTSISPDTKIINSAQFDMTVSGTNFVNGAVVKFSGSARATTFISATELTATILASDLTVLGVFDITVANPAPVLSDSNAQQFSVINQSPFISTISPSYKIVGDAQFDMTVIGINFITDSVVKFNGAARSTAYVSDTELTATILATDLLTATSSALITVTNPAPGGGTSNAEVFAVYNPTPTTTSISPDSKTVGDAQFDMTVSGTNFLSGATVKFNGSDRSTTYVSGTELTAVIPATDLLVATSSALITVANPFPTLADSNAQTFAVNPVGNPLPTVTSISPTSKVAGDPQFTLTVDGTNFIAASVVRFGGSDMVTTYVSPVRVTAEIPASEISVAGNFNVRVFNPLPGGGLSDPQLFTVTAVPPTVAVKFSLSSADSETVGSPVIVTIRALKSDNSIDVNFNNGVTLVSSGSATGGGLANLVNGIASVAIYDSVAETITLSLSDTQGTGLDVSATKNITFVPVAVSAPGAGPSVRPTTLEISGRAFPGATISLIEKKSGQPSVSSQTIDISDKGDFKITTIGIIQGEYTYNLLVRDRQGRLSQTKTYNVNFISDSLFERNVLIAPTIALAKTTIQRGDILKVSGYAYPQSKVTLNLNGISYETNSTASGTYEFSINTSLLNTGSYFARVKWTDSRTKLDTDWSTAQSLLISPAAPASANIDLDRNGIIDVRDWSIFLSRFNSSNPEIIRSIDFNKDGRADVADRTIFLENYAVSTAR